MARGQASRRRIRPGYLSCGICNRDLPVDEFRIVRTQLADGSSSERRYSYCKPCSSAMNSAEAKRKKSDPVQRSRNRDTWKRQYKRLSKERREERAFRLSAASTAVTRLIASGMSRRAIALKAGVHQQSIANWSRGEGSPFSRHVAVLRALVAEISA